MQIIPNFSEIISHQYIPENCNFANLNHSVTSTLPTGWAAIEKVIHEKSWEMHEPFLKVAFFRIGLLFQFFLHFSSLFRGNMDEKHAKNAHFFLKLCHVILNLVI